MTEPEIKKGLAGVYVDYTAVSKVYPETNSLLYRGYPVHELAVPEEVGDGLERLRRGELLHGVAPVQQGVRVGVDLRHRRVVDDDSGEALLDVGSGHGVLLRMR